MVVVASSVLGLACSDDDRAAGPVEPPEPAGPPPSVLATVSLSDAPVGGELVLDLSEGGARWDFEVDLDDDGAFDDAEGRVDGERRVPYRFDEVGIHRVRLRFQRRGTSFTTDRLVVVNDPDAFAVEKEFRAAPEDTRVFPPLFSEHPEGVSVTRDNEHLFVGGGNIPFLFHFRTDDLSLVESVSLLGIPLLGTFEGLALSADETRLVVITNQNSYAVLTAPELEILGWDRPVSLADFFVDALGDRRFVLSGGGPAAVLVDVETGASTAGEELPGIVWDIEPSPTRETVAVVSRSSAGSWVQLLDAGTFRSEWVTQVSSTVSLTSVAFHPGGDRIYAFGWDDEAFWLFVVRTRDGDLLDEIRIERHQDFHRVPGAANPTATTYDGRFVIFPTADGAYLVDTSLDVPRFRLSTPGPVADEIGCCNVATPENVNAIYFVNHFRPANVFKVRLTK